MLSAPPFGYTGRRQPGATQVDLRGVRWLFPRFTVSLRFANPSVPVTARAHATTPRRPLAGPPLNYYSS
eukprot:40393-Prorocentrum_minimum.AAC.2